MKLKQILSEIKLIPQNRILLKKDKGHDDYYFELKNKHLQVWKLRN
jgi:phage pi2 protein 07